MPGADADLTTSAEPRLNSIGIAAAQVLELAIVDAVRSATSVEGVIASCDWLTAQ
jgi:L-aminopeptidase/D-esterase-like protein